MDLPPRVIWETIVAKKWVKNEVFQKFNPIFQPFSPHLGANALFGHFFPFRPEARNESVPGQCDCTRRLPEGRRKSCVYLCSCLCPSPPRPPLYCASSEQNPPLPAPTWTPPRAPESGPASNFWTYCWNELPLKVPECFWSCLRMPEISCLLRDRIVFWFSSLWSGQPLEKRGLLTSLQFVRALGPRNADFPESRDIGWNGTSAPRIFAPCDLNHTTCSTSSHQGFSKGGGLLRLSLEAKSFWGVVNLNL